MPRLSATPIIAWIALALAVSTGSAAAGVAIGRNTVGTAQVRDGSIRLKDIAPGALEALRADRGPVGPQGPQGQQGSPGERGPKGDTGAAGAGGHVVIRKGSNDAAHLIPPGRGSGFGITCAPGEQVIGGGASLLNLPDGEAHYGDIRASYPSTQPNGVGEWLTTIYNTHPTANAIGTGYAVCLAP